MQGDHVGFVHSLRQNSRIKVKLNPLVIKLHFPEDWSCGEPSYTSAENSFEQMQKRNRQAKEEAPWYVEPQASRWDPVQAKLSFLFCIIRPQTKQNFSVSYSFVFLERKQCQKRILICSAFSGEWVSDNTARFRLDSSGLNQPPRCYIQAIIKWLREIRKINV